MAAPIGRWFLARAPRFFFKNKPAQSLQSYKTKYLINIGHSQISGPTGLKRRLLYHALRALFSHDPVQSLTAVKNVSHNRPDSRYKQSPRSFTTSARKSAEEGSEGEAPKNSKKPLKLMDFQEIIWPHPLKSLRNLWFSMLIRGYFDNTYSPEVFLKGAEQAISTVSALVSEGKFDDLENLVARDAIREIRKNYHDLTPKQRCFIKVDARDLFFRFIYEIGMIFDDKTNQRYVEITAVFQGIHGMNEFQTQSSAEFSEHMKNSQDQVYVCNYRFIREFTKGVEDSWTINKLNHFSPKELVSNTGIFQR